MSCVCDYSINLFCLCISLQSPRERNMQLMHFNCRVKASSNEKWRVWIVQTSPYAPSSVHNRNKKKEWEWSRLSATKLEFLELLLTNSVQNWFYYNADILIYKYWRQTFDLQICQIDTKVIIYSSKFSRKRNSGHLRVLLDCLQVFTVQSPYTTSTILTSSDN